MRYIRIIILTILIPFAANAQLVNTGEKLFIDNSGLIYVPGNMVHKGGLDFNNGKLIIVGDIDNQDGLSTVFDMRSLGKVVLNGATQKITGNPISFPALELSGSGIKYLEINASIAIDLNLEDREFVINNNSLSITSSLPTAIKRSTGYVNTDLGGKLIRSVAVNNQYVYPLGSSSAGRYRPVLIEPQDVGGIFAATLFNTDPNLKGYNRNSKRQDIKEIFDQYWYNIDEVSGGINTKVSFLLNTNDKAGSQLVKWINLNLWEKATPATQKTGDMGDGLNLAYLYTTTSKIDNKPFTLANTNENQQNPFTFFNAFSPDGDGKNDTWIIKNSSYFPDNELLIINRWGDEVFKAKNYSDVNAWDGGSLSAGTYYYIFNVTINGVRESYKGFITMVKK